MYKLTLYGVIRTADNAVIPMDDGNRDYRKYLDWLSAGNVPEPADPEPADPEPDIVTISADSNIIIGDGIDEILLNVTGKPNTLITLNVLTGASPSTINIQLDENGSGVQAFSCYTSPTVIVFSYGEIIAKVRSL